MAERSLVDYMLREMKGRWRGPVKHADSWTAGISDISAWIPRAGNCWFELKALPKWPQRADTSVSKWLDLRDNQRLFLLNRHGFLFTRVGRDYLLHRWDLAFHSMWTQAEMRRDALVMWTGKVDWDQFVEVVVNERPNEVEF